MVLTEHELRQQIALQSRVVHRLERELFKARRRLRELQQNLMVAKANDDRLSKKGRVK